MHSRHTLGRSLSRWFVALALGLSITSGCSESTPAGTKELTTAPAKPLTTGEEVLDAMAAAYANASSYSDQARVRLVIDGDKPVDKTGDLSVQYVRPNKLRLRAYEATVVCDGRTLEARLDGEPGQYVSKDSPEILTRDAINADQYLQQAAQGFGGESPQLTLLLHRDGLRAMLGNAEKPALAEPGEIDGQPCYRVEVRSVEGKSTFWVNQRTLVLRRFEYPTDQFMQAMSRQSAIKSLSMVLDFTGATLNGEIPAAAFAMDPPAGVVASRFFTPRAPQQLLGQPVPAFEFVDLEGKKVTAATYTGKILVLYFWDVNYGPSRQILPMLDKVREAYEGHDVIILAVNVNPPEVDAAKLKETFEHLGVSVPIVRDVSNQLPLTFRTNGVPCSFIIDAKGTVQDFENGPNPNLVTQLPAKIEQVRAGKSIYEAQLAEYRKSLEKYEKLIDLVASGRSFEQALAEVEAPPKATLAPKTEPRRLNLRSLWTNKDVKMPGNIVVLPGPSGVTLGVVDACKGVAEIGLDGKTIARHRVLGDGTSEAFSQLRVAADRSGKRYLVAFAPTQQRMHFVDGDWRVAFSFPEDAIENPHAGLADVELADLDGDGRPEIYVGYSDVVGVQSVSLDGKRTGSYRAIANVLRMAPSGPASDGQRALYCINTAGPMVVLDAHLQRVADVVVQDRGISWIVSAELTGNPQPQFCGLYLPRLGETVAIGFDGSGQELWNYPMPEGVHEFPVEQIIAGHVTGNTGQWILPGCDGSIHILSPDGHLVDRFNYGKSILGVASAEVDGKPLLIIASPDGVEGLLVE